MIGQRSGCKKSRKLEDNYLCLRQQSSNFLLSICFAFRYFFGAFSSVATMSFQNGSTVEIFNCSEGV